jgi:hypothetical protein
VEPAAKKAPKGTVVPNLAVETIPAAKKFTKSVVKNEPVREKSGPSDPVQLWESAPKVSPSHSNCLNYLASLYAVSSHITYAPNAHETAHHVDCFV